MRASCAKVYVSAGKQIPAMKEDTVARDIFCGGVWVVLGIGSLLCTRCVFAVHAGTAGPNIIFILADDVGFEALGCYGGQTYRTPNLDALAASGVRFTYCFASPVCSPSRAEFLTGQYPFRTGFTDLVGRGGAPRSLDPRRHPTIAGLLKRAGYATAIAGKWHLTVEPMPQDQFPDAVPQPDIAACGFDVQYCFTGPHIQYGAPVPGEYHPDLYQEWVLNYLTNRKDRDQPFFLYYATGLPHRPWDPTPLNPNAVPGDRGNFPVMLEYLDRQVGEVLGRLEELGMRDGTLVLFSGDNGTDAGLPAETLNGRLVRPGKGTMRDTGSWVPLIASWPAAIERGGVCNDLIDFSDFLPTLLEVAGAPAYAGRIDGVSFADQLLGRAASTPRRWVYVQYQDKQFVRDKQFKLMSNGALYDVSGSPFAEVPIPPVMQDAAARAARRELSSVLNALN